MLGVVGESGSGKSVSMLTVMGLTRARERDHLRLGAASRGATCSRRSDDELRRIRGNDIAMIFQDPLSSLHPFYKVGTQLVEAMQAHRDVSKAAARERAVELLGMVGIPDPRQRVDAYPHEFSGGMRQRAMIAMALANEPKLLIADEPTTALDVTVQAQILELIARLQRELGMAVVLITHDLGVVAEVTDQIVVMYAGRIVEAASTEKIFRAPEHPYTWGLLQSIPRLDRPRDEPLVPIAGPAAEPDQPPERLLVPSALPVRARAAPPGRARSSSRCPTTPSHRVACLLDSDTRKQIWAELRAGHGPAAGARGRRARGGAGMSDEPLVEVRDLVKHFPLTRGIVFQKTGRRRARGRRRLLRRAARRDARDRRRDRAAARRPPRA